MNRLPFLGAVLLSFVILFTPPGGVPSVEINDKLVHGALFCLLAGTARYAGFGWLAVLPASIGYAVASEIIQMTLIGRDGSAGDVLADVCGALIGLLICWLWNRRRAAPPRPG